jgi:hypothetical protein
MLEYLEIATTLVALCSAICAATPTPKDDELASKVEMAWAKAYKVLEMFALNVGKAKQ